MRTKLLLTLFCISLCLNITSCMSVRVHPHKDKTIPPGQIKKVTGSKSARYYAPGHNIVLI